MINYIKGYYVLIVEGIDTEKYLNFICKNKVSIYNVKRIDKTKVEFSVSRGDLKKIKNMYRGNKFEVKIKQKTGIPFLAKRIYKYKTMVFSAVVSLLLLLLTTQFVTDIYIDCPEGIDKKVLQDELEECGLKPGVFKKTIDRKIIRDHIMQEIDEVAYLSINVKGTNVFVTVTKKDDENTQTSNSNYCNIIASKNGIIEKVIARSGEAVVQVGDIVKKGDLLIQGANTSAMPQVWATTFYESVQKKPYIETINKKTGKSKNIYTITFYDKEYEIKRNIKYNDYVIENKTKEIKIGNYTFPVKIIVSTFYEVTKKEVEVDVDKLKDELKQKALKDLYYMMPASAKMGDVNYQHKVSKNMLEYIVTVQASEDISKVYSLSKQEINKIIQENSKSEDGEPVPSNPQKRPINDIKNEYEQDQDKKDSETKNNQ
ncbi:MAG: sporulation protein YqfD [Intestinibacter bartlettii]|uniref:sporulation protein YqfD n=1 Tax=Intestinibacter bartlettii TaxID=261299 RepID=UPI0026F351D2|nr:sporulation protein YqfD [Intestinibacter bartlettii]MDO5010123.1 sporulation protein YqfD [Intestinibacter bartlettii]